MRRGSKFFYNDRLLFDVCALRNIRSVHPLGNGCEAENNHDYHFETESRPETT